MTALRFALVIASIFILCAGATALFYSLVIVYEVRTISADVRVDNFIGFNLDTDSMHFGRVLSPGSSDRTLIISHNASEPLLVQIHTEGTMAPWVRPEENNFILEPGTTKQVRFIMDMPEGVPSGQYNGTIKIYFKRKLW